MYNPATASVPPYVAYRTFRSFIQLLGPSVPSRIDRSLMASMSGATQSQLIHALRYLRLISLDGEPSAELVNLVGENDHTRGEALGGVLRTGYEFLWQNGVKVESATIQQLEEQFAETGASGETVSRCVRFFVAAAMDAQLPVSRHISAARFRRGRRKSVTKKQVATAKTAVPESATYLRREQHTKVVGLKKGGTIQLVADFNPFDLTFEEQGLLQALNAQVAKFEQGRQKEAKENVADNGVSLAG